MFMFLVSCVPQQPLTDEELKAELSKLTPEERAQLLKDLDNKEGGAFAGQAIASKYRVSSRVRQTSTSRIKDVLLTSKCSDTDNGVDFFKKGEISGSDVSASKDYCVTFQGPNYNYADQCTHSSGGLADCGVLDYYCVAPGGIGNDTDPWDPGAPIKPSGTNPSAKYVAWSLVKVCKYGCKDGACIK